MTSAVSSSAASAAASAASSAASSAAPASRRPGLLRSFGSGFRQARASAVAAVRPPDLVWAGFVVVMVAAMLLVRHQMTIPYHFIFVSFTLLYGFRLWSPGVTLAVLLLLTAVTGGIFLDTYLAGDVALDELAEVPLMPAIVGAMVWHAHRSAAARHRLEELATLESSRLQRQRDFLRDSAHAIRTPVTIARGYVELIQTGSREPRQVGEDTAEVLHQLDRLHRLAARLLAIEALQTTDRGTVETVALGRFAAEKGRRWSNSAPRRWRVVPAAGHAVRVDPIRLEEALDAMVENALRFTSPDDVIRIEARDEDAWVRLEVADSGPGIPVEDRRRVLERFFHRPPRGEEPGTGLGLALVAAVADAFGADVHVGEAPEGGALVALSFPAA
jgi:signal transduction histidine kinase